MSIEKHINKYKCIPKPWLDTKFEGDILLLNGEYFDTFGIDFNGYPAHLAIIIIKDDREFQLFNNAKYANSYAVALNANCWFKNEMPFYEFFDTNITSYEII